MIFLKIDGARQGSAYKVLKIKCANNFSIICITILPLLRLTLSHKTIWEDMCGISFILSKNGSEQGQALAQMQVAQRHRGPDWQQVYQIRTSFGRLHFGHTRLNILDLSPQSNQPIFSPQKGQILLYNGEIYNYKKLDPQAISDSIALSTWFEAQGDSPDFSQLNGMYAAVIYAPQTQRLWAFCDPSGIKPLFYYEDAHYLILASEVRAILASGLVSKRLNDKQIAHYLHFRFAQKPETFFENIFALNGGRTWLKGKVEQSFGLPLMPFVGEKASLKGLPELVKSHLQKSLKQQLLQSDVEVGLSLSGGVDSTLLLALSRELGLGKLSAFTVVEENAPPQSDTHFARLAAQQYGADLEEISLSPKDLRELPDFAANLNQPIGDFAAWLSLKLAQTAKQRVKVLLSGAGADELFGGYHRHWAYGHYLRYRRFYLAARKPMGLLAKLGRDGHFSRQLRQFASAIQGDKAETFRNFTRLQTWELAPDYRVMATESFAGGLAYDRKHFLQSDVLAINDQMFMQHSLEMRVPYLDESLQSLTQAYPEENLWNPDKKWILKKILNDLGGEVYCQRRKTGFGLNLAEWLRQPASRFLLEYLQERRLLLYQYVEFAAVKRYIQLHLACKADFSPEIWALLLLAYWLEAQFA